jgi:hypothetical protein
MTKNKDNGAKVIVPCKDHATKEQVRGTTDSFERKAPDPVRDTLSPPPPQKPEKK